MFAHLGLRVLQCYLLKKWMQNIIIENSTDDV